MYVYAVNTSTMCLSESVPQADLTCVPLKDANGVLEGLGVWHASIEDGCVHECCVHGAVDALQQRNSSSTREQDV